MTKDVRDKNSVLMLGTGTSTGIPLVGCSCVVCASNNPKDKRFRSSIQIVSKRNKSILIDTGPDLRLQLLNNHIKHIDGVILTHDHADHCHGIDDLRPLCFFKDDPLIPIGSHRATIDILTKRFDYIFQKKGPALGGGVPILEFHELKEGNQSFIDEEFYFFLNPHGKTQTLGICHHKMAYIIDCVEIAPEHIKFLKNQNLDHLIIDCPRRRPHDTHLHLEKALHYIEQISPKKAGLTHLGHDFGHNALSKELQANYGNLVQVLYDGQSLSYND